MFTGRWHVFVTLIRATHFRQDGYGSGFTSLNVRQALGQSAEVAFDVVTQECRECRRAALVRNVGHLDTRSLLDQRHRQVIVAARCTAGDAHAAGTLFGRGHKFFERLEWAARWNQENQLGLNEACNRRHTVDR